MKSLEFVRERIKNGYCSNMKMKDFNNMSEHSFMDFLAYYYAENLYPLFKNNILEYEISGECGGEKGSRKISVEYNPDSKFEYFTMEQCVCDGTLMFLDSLKCNIMQKLLRSETYNKETIPSNYISNVWDYDIKYSVGDFVVNSEYGDFGTEEKPWMHIRFTVMLPIKCEIVKK